jgi:hypothetical protein
VRVKRTATRARRPGARARLEHAERRHPHVLSRPSCHGGGLSTIARRYHRANGGSKSCGVQLSATSAPRHTATPRPHSLRCWLREPCSRLHNCHLLNYRLFLTAAVQQVTAACCHSQLARRSPPDPRSDYYNYYYRNGACSEDITTICDYSSSGCACGFGDGRCHHCWNIFLTASCCSDSSFRYSPASAIPRASAVLELTSICSSRLAGLVLHADSRTARLILFLTL